MGYKVDEDWDLAPYVEKNFVCSPPQVFRYSTLMSQKTTAWNDTSSRPYPSDPLSSQTSMPTQYTEKWTRGSVKARTGWTMDFSCPSPWPYYGTYEYNYHAWPRQIEAAETVCKPDWQLIMRNKIKEEALNIGTTLAEYKQSVRMFGSAGTAVMDAWRTFRGKAPRKRRKSLTMCSVAASELVYTYGVAPLFSDVYTTAEILLRRLEQPYFREYFVRANGSDRGTWSDANGKGRYWQTRTQRAKFYVWFDMQRASNFKLGNPLEIAWELVPYSFVFDWLIPVGSWLSSIDALSATEKIRGTVSEKVKYGHIGHVKLSGLDGTVWGSTPSTYKRTEHTRTFYDTVPFPTIPRWDPSFSWRKALNATALLVNFRRQHIC